MGSSENNTIVQKTFNGVEFTFVYISAWQVNGIVSGVVYDPVQYDLNDELFIDAYELAIAYYPTFLAKTRLYNAIDSIACMGINFMDSLRFLDKERFTILMSAYKEAKKEGCYISDEEHQKVELARQAYYNEVVIRRQTNDTSQATAQSGYVYLLRSDTGFYKIGRAKNPKNRLATFNVKLPFEVQFEHLIKSNDYKRLEKELHERYDHLRVNGEWFNLDPKDIEEILKMETVNYEMEAN